MLSFHEFGHIQAGHGWASFSGSMGLQPQMDMLENGNGMKRLAPEPQDRPRSSNQSPSEPVLVARSRKHEYAPGRLGAGQGF